MDQFNHVWVTQHEGPVLVRNMTRSHVRNSLQWCMRRLDSTVLGTDLDTMLASNWSITGSSIDYVKDKDGFYYSEWIAIFTARLLDPELAD